MENFWDFKVWGVFNLIAVLLIALVVANIVKRTVPFLRVSLIPTSVLGGGILPLLWTEVVGCFNEFSFGEIVNDAFLFEGIIYFG